MPTVASLFDRRWPQTLRGSNGQRAQKVASKLARFIDEDWNVARHLTVGSRRLEGIDGYFSGADGRHFFQDYLRDGPPLETGRDVQRRMIAYVGRAHSPPRPARSPHKRSPPKRSPPKRARSPPKRARSPPKRARSSPPKRARPRHASPPRKYRATGGRRSPGFSGNSAQARRGGRHLGVDGHYWRATRNSNGVYTWKRA
jgi:hypothetical protein